jgi:hypothetical protein
VFVVGVAQRFTTVLLRDGFVTEEFIDLARTQNRSRAQETRLDELKTQLADRVINSSSENVLDAM